MEPLGRIDELKTSSCSRCRQFLQYLGLRSVDPRWSAEWRQKLPCTALSRRNFVGVHGGPGMSFLGGSYPRAHLVLGSGRMRPSWLDSQSPTPSGVRFDCRDRSNREEGPVETWCRSQLERQRGRLSFPVLPVQGSAWRQVLR